MQKACRHQSGVFVQSLKEVVQQGTSLHEALRSWGVCGGGFATPKSILSMSARLRPPHPTTLESTCSFF